MSATMITLNFSVTIEDIEKLPRNQDTDSVTNQLDYVMRRAGEEFVAKHPDWFKVGIT